MKNYSKSILALIFSLYIPLVSCNTSDLIFKSPQKDLSTDSLVNSKYLLTGKVNLSDFKVNTFKTKAVDPYPIIATRASVTLLYPSDYSVVNLRGTAVSAGITDISGNFKFNPSDNFTPTLNQVFVLEASNRLGGIGNPIISLRTIVKWNGTGWDSISKPNIYINRSTTAISIIANFSPLTFSSNDAIGRLTFDNKGRNIVTYDTKLTKTDVDYVSTAITTIIGNNFDPLEHIYSKSEYFFGGDYIHAQDLSRESSAKANMHTLQTAAETYAVDWAGIYADSIESLISEAKSKNYWKPLRNPFTNNIDEIITSQEYLQIQNTLLYKNNPINDISDIKGFIIYDALKDTNLPQYTTSYAIYGLDNSGIKIKDRSSDFVLSNY